MSDPPSLIESETYRLPTSTFGVVAMWGVLEFCVCFSADRWSLSAFEPAQVILLPIMLSGVVAALLKSPAWLLLAAGPPATAPPHAVVRSRWLSISVATLPTMIPVAAMLDPDGPPVGELICLLLVFLMGCSLLFLWLRSYLRFRLIHRAAEASHDCSESRVSIRGLMAVTGVVAMILAVCRWLAGDMIGELMVAGLMGVICGLNWSATALWMLGRRVAFVPLKSLVLLLLIAEMLILGVVAYMASAAWDEIVGSIAMLAGLQLHLMLFLGVMRAAEFRFVRLRKLPLSLSADPVNLLD